MLFERVGVKLELLGYALLWALVLTCFSGCISISGLSTAGAAGPDGNPSLLFASSLVATTMSRPLISALACLLKPKPGLFVRLGEASCLALSAVIAMCLLMPSDMLADHLRLAFGGACGILTSVIDMAWSDAYGRVEPRVSGRALPLSMALGALICLFTRLADALFPVIASMLLMAMPLGCGLLLRRAVPGVGSIADEPVANEGSRAFAAGLRSSAGLLWRPVVCGFAFYFAFGFCLNIMGNAVGIVGGEMSAAGIVVVALESLACVGMACFLGGERRASVAGVYSIVLVLVVCGLALLTIGMQLEDYMGVFLAASVTVGVAGTVYDALLLTMVAHTAFDYRVSGAILNGLARGSVMLVSAAGALIGNALISSDLVADKLGTTIYTQVATVLVVVTAALFLGRRRIAVVPADERAVSEGMRFFEVLAPNAATVGARHAAGAATGDDPLRPAVTAIVIEAGAAPELPAWMSHPENDSPESAEELLGRLEAEISRLASENGLSRRESEVFGFIARGRSVPYIAQEMVVSENTVQSHVRRVYKKLGVHTRQELIDLVERGISGKPSE